MSTKIQKESSGPAGCAGIHPDCMYTAEQFQAILNAGKNFSMDMERAGFSWRCPPWRKTAKFAMGRDLIEFIFRE